MKMVKLTHWSLVVLFGLNILPTIIARKLALTHTDIVVECFLFRFVDQVQLRALVTERLAQTFALGLFYSSLSMPWPILQAVVINLISLIVGIALDVRNRRTYMQVCSSPAHASNKAKML
ncbi:hypothetical protein DUNSADRAFT_2482 [Dunaliella salina]|uniref:Encoded protein n=1 Tax=Dunaliella salina TaxID=3046 RepID=A0ABQ7GVV0_DUNSA|nr:hypothetical protein DUNSADRAFT_2482 [Dunaliella salina]|eukprot:KAF5838647.1 hypothetical protein DUNSADRAFT_2482 [Dunaliella salina]